MNVTLKVAAGVHAGKELAVPVPKCLIGRHPDCDLRLKSQAISRHHCVLYVRDGNVFVRDLKSRNGTLVNGQRIQTDWELRGGDKLQIGPLTAEIRIAQGRETPLKSASRDVHPAAANRQLTARRSQDDESAAEWLEQADAIAESQRRGVPDRLRLEQKPADAPACVEAGEARPTASNLASVSQQTETAVSPAVAQRRASLRDPKRMPGKLPRPQEPPTADSREAAEKMLKRYFGRR